MNKSQIIFLIRSYNEAKRIGQVIDSIIAEGFKKILVVDDGSTDNTEEILKKYLNIIYIKHTFNRGGGAALETGFEYLRKNYSSLEVDYLTTFDADGQHNIKDIYNFIKEFEQDKDLDIVFGSRFIQKTNSNVPLTRRLILFGGMIFTYLISSIKLTDSHNGYRMIKCSSLDKIKLTMDGMEYASELIEQVNVNELRFKEVPVNIIYDDYTLSKGQKNSNAIFIASKVIWNKFFKL